jgi:hypothetical protein
MIKNIINYIFKKMISEESLIYFFSSGTNSKILQLKDFDYLYQVGWVKSCIEIKSIDNEGNPIPWFTYPCVDFLKEKTIIEATIFEYGLGNSSLFFQTRVKEIYGVESDKEWYKWIKKHTDDKANCNFILVELINEEYVNSISHFNKKFDIILIDGFLRNECIFHSIKYLNEKGVIILDDSQLLQYKESVDFLLNNGFKVLNFWGMTPITTFKKCTSIFYKLNNILKI